MILLLFTSTLSVSLQPLSYVSAEPDEFINSGTITTYYYETQGDAVSYNVTLEGQRMMSSWIHSFDSKVVEGPRLTFTTDLPVSEVHGPYPPGSILSWDSTYKFAFPDVEPGGETHVGINFDPNLVSGSFITDFSASRTIAPNVIEYPGGTQTITLSVTPLRSEFELTTILGPAITLRVWLLEYDNLTASVVSVTWPTVGETETLYPTVSEKEVECSIRDPRMGTTYALVVVISIGLEEGIRTVEYKPPSEVRDLVSLTPTQPFYGKGNQTYIIDGVTWKWSTTSEHKWLITVDSRSEDVRFLPSSRFTTGYKLVIGDMPPGEDYQTWVDRGATFSSDDIPYSFATENATTCYYLSNYTRYRFMGWTGDHESASFPFDIGISHSTLINANWAKEHEVTIRSSKDSSTVTEYEGWYDENATFQYQAEVKMTRDFFNDYVLDHYTINDVVHTERDISVSVTEPLDVLVNYRNEINVMNVSMVAIPIVAVASIIIILGMRKRKSE